MCGGKGSRLGKLGEKIPKTLLKLQNKSIIDYLIINLNKNGIEKILLSTFYKHHLIKKHINSYGCNFNEKQKEILKTS